MKKNFRLNVLAESQKTTALDTLNNCRLKESIYRNIIGGYLKTGHVKLLVNVNVLKS